jgi:DNA primase
MMLGSKQTERVIPIASKVGVNLSIITIPSGKDPDELIKQDVKVWQDIIQQSDPVIDWVIERYTKMVDINTGLGKKQFTDRILSVIADLTDSVEQDHYFVKVSKLLGVHVDSLRLKASQLPEDKPVRLKPVAKQPRINKQDADDIRSQNKLLALVLYFPSLRPYLDKLAPQNCRNYQNMVKC